MAKFRFLLLFAALTFINKRSFCQEVTTEEIRRYYDKYYVKENIKLGAIYPIKKITKITIRNDWRKNHTLTKLELEKMKKALLEATSNGGLLLKPGHLSMEIEFEKPDMRTKDYVYMYSGSIHFDTGIDNKGKRFCGSFDFPKSIDFEKYGN